MVSVFIAGHLVVLKNYKTLAFCKTNEAVSTLANKLAGGLATMSKIHPRYENDPRKKVIIRFDPDSLKKQHLNAMAQLEEKHTAFINPEDEQVQAEAVRPRKSWQRCNIFQEEWSLKFWVIPTISKRDQRVREVY